MGLESLMPMPPSEERISVERKPVDEVCPKCGSEHVARYPVANFIGPRMVTKCQDCFFSLAVDVPAEDDHWPPWRSATRDWPTSRAG
jgi:ssDNA-binding Zn-finger/Zn-ribbon topoisomerase 1